MTKRKRTYEEVIGMQAKAVRLQENVNNFEASVKIENLAPSEYAAWQNIEIVSEPVRKRKRSIRKTENTSVPSGYTRRTQVTEWTSLTETGGRKRHREVRTETWKAKN
jgi:hypothetical protein